MKKFMKGIIVSAMALVLIAPAYTYAQDDSALWGGRKDAIKENIGVASDRDPRDIAAAVINVLMGFLGIVAVVIILLGGFKWMTAAGNEDKIDEAKKLLAAGIIGLVIILSAWGIATFVLNSILGATGAGSAA